MVYPPKGTAVDDPTGPPPELPRAPPIPPIPQDPIKEGLDNVADAIRTEGIRIDDAIREMMDLNTEAIDVATSAIHQLRAQLAKLVKHFHVYRKVEEKAGTGHLLVQRCTHCGERR